MQQEIPSPAEVRQRLEKLSWAEVQALCQKCRAPFTTVWKLRSGETTDPRLETVRAIWPELNKAKGAPEIPAHATEEVDHG